MRLWIAAALLVACDDGGGQPARDAATLPPRDAFVSSVDATPPLAEDAAPLRDAAPDAAMRDAAPDAASMRDAGPVARGADVGAADCFSNFDCPEAQVCRNLGTDDAPVPCCVPGARGRLAAGEPCDPATGEADCASSICVEGDQGARCSTTCRTPDDCPAGMRQCVPIAFSPSPDDWCLPGP